jgi:heme exporter protein C
MLKKLHELLSFKTFYRLSGHCLPFLFVVTALAFAVGLVDAFLLAPSDGVQGEGYRIIFIHVPSAYLSLMIYAVMSIAAGLYLVFDLKLATIVMKSCAPVGALFTLLALITGAIWGKPMWGTWWIWDARLTSELILLIWYCAVLSFANIAKAHSFGPKAVAILILIGVVNLPIIHFSVEWWHTLHQGPTLSRFAMPAMDARMLRPLLTMIVAATCYFALVLLISIRTHILSSEKNKQWVKHRHAVE